MTAGSPLAIFFAAISIGGAGPHAALELCYYFDARRYKACGGLGSYLNPTNHEIELWLSATSGVALPEGSKCEWRIGGELVATAACGERISGPGIALPYPGGADISVNVVGDTGHRSGSSA